MLYCEFKEDENATVVISRVSGVTTDQWGNIIPNKIEVFNNNGIYYETSSAERVARSQIQEEASHDLLLDSTKITTQLLTTDEVLITTKDVINKPHRIVTIKDPLNKCEVVILKLKEI